MNKFYLLFCLSFALSFGELFARQLHVSPSGSDRNEGTVNLPFATISRAAYYALAGDSVIVHEGVYREWVSPANSGINANRRIVYMAHPGDQVVIKGSEQIQNWKKIKKNVWRTQIDNSFFNDFNPYTINVDGDWLNSGHYYHLGEVFSEGQSLLEVLSLDSLNVNTWFAEVDDDMTTLYANFGNKNPNKTITEINVRPVCFFPKTTGVNYITVKGFHLTQAATQWSAPTSEQVGLIGPNWSKGWIIEDCEISNSKCVGLCLGKERASGHNMWTLYARRFGYMKHGFNREIEAILKAIDLGWNKENIGSHVIRNNKIHDCGQAGIVGHMGGAFCTITNNEIYNINLGDVRMSGAETGGIKLHAAIDTRIERNFIRNCVRGIWLDWQAQGTQVCSNIFLNNKIQDLFIEVSHGPSMIYNNLFLSKTNLLIDAQGIACFNNLFSGSYQLRTSRDRYTPYHVPHSTKVCGFFESTGGDVRFYNNIFLAAKKTKTRVPGLSCYDDFPEYDEHMGDTLKKTDEFTNFRFPVWTSRNVYFKSSKPYKNEKNYLDLTDISGNFELLEAEDGWYFFTSVPNEKLEKFDGYPISTETLHQTFISEAIYDNPDFTPFILESDFLGDKNDPFHPNVGPLKTYKRVKVWTK